MKIKNQTFYGHSQNFLILWILGALFCISCSNANDNVKKTLDTADRLMMRAPRAST